MGQWEPLADRIPLDMRRLATQLRRMKDRSSLTVPALAARTAESADAWAGYLAARRVPPLAAVEVLAQASGADYDRIGALWKLAEKASAGPGDRAAGKPVPQPDPLDPLGAEDGLPTRRRRLFLFAATGVLAVAALLVVVLMAGTSSSRAPAGDAGSTGNSTTATGAPAPSAVPRGRTPASNTGVPGSGTDFDTGTPAGTVSGPPATATPATPVPSSAGTTTSPAGAPAPTASGTATAAPTATGTPAPTATPAPTHTGLCLGLILLGICIG